MAHMPMPQKWENPHKSDWEKPSGYTYPQPPKTLASFFNDMFFLGFNDQVQRWNALHTASAGKFPPYNLIKVDANNYKVEMAVAGYSKDDISVTVERDQLLVSSKEKDEEPTEGVVYQGIAQRQWSQKFILGEYMEVKDVFLKDGLLTINVVRNLPEDAKPKTIKIK